MTNMQPDPKEILDNLYDGVYFVDPDRRITYWNKGAERITGYPAGRVVGRFCRDNILNHITENGVQLCTDGCPLQASMADGIMRQAEVYMHHADGHRVPILVRTTPIRDTNGRIVGGVETFSDNTSLLTVRRRARDLEKTVLLDPLTGVGNRRHFEMKLKSAFVEQENYPQPFGLLFLDIDHFKQINDEIGHDAGDQVLRMVARTLQRNVRNDDTLARWGGEEFIVLLVNIDRKGLETAAEKLRILIENSHLTVNGKEIHVTISIGATLASPADTITSLVQRADQKMYQSKQAGRNRTTTG
jgi:diguanylate cyclase (GGDEF)-like protein/PAS domain S-box-containing protein